MIFPGLQYLPLLMLDGTKRRDDKRRHTVFRLVWESQNFKIARAAFFAIKP